MQQVPVLISLGLCLARSKLARSAIVAVRMLLRALTALVLAAATAPALPDETDYTPIVRSLASPAVPAQADELRMMFAGRPTGRTVTVPRSVLDRPTGQEPRDDGPACSSHPAPSSRIMTDIAFTVLDDDAAQLEGLAAGGRRDVELDGQLDRLFVPLSPRSNRLS